MIIEIHEQNPLVLTFHIKRILLWVIQVRNQCNSGNRLDQPCYPLLPKGPILLRRSLDIGNARWTITCPNPRSHIPLNSLRPDGLPSDLWLRPEGHARILGPYRKSRVYRVWGIYGFDPYRPLVRKTQNPIYNHDHLKPPNNPEYIYRFQVLRPVTPTVSAFARLLAKGPPDPIEVPHEAALDAIELVDKVPAREVHNVGGSINKLNM